MPAIARKSAARTAKRRSTPKPIAVALLDVDAIDPSPENRRADIDLAPLVESVRTYGIQTPIKVRPKDDRFEIVFGERRWRAAKELGLTTIPATVEDLTDEEAQARRVLENAQRKDPHALEEAEAYERLLAMRDRKGKPIHTPESIAQVAGRSVAHVYNRLKLTALAPELRKAFCAGELNVTGAFLIARGVPTALQAEAWSRMKRYSEEEGYDDEDQTAPLDTEIIDALIAHDYAFRLDGAPFPLGDAKLVAEAGPCTACPKRSVNQPALFSEPGQRDVCTDVTCWRAKVAALADRERREAFAAGGTVLLDNESRRVLGGGSTLPWNSPWIDLDAPCPDHPERRPWRELLGDFCLPPVLAFTSTGKPVHLASKDEALDALLRNGVDLAALRGRVEPLSDDGHALPDDDGSARPPMARAPRDPTEARFAADVARTSQQRILAAVVAATEAAPPEDARFVSLVYETLLHGGYHNAVVDTVKRRLGKVPKGEQPAAALAAIAAAINPPSLRGLVLELCLSRGACFVMSSEKYPRDLARAIEAYAIDADAIEAAVRHELEAKRSARRFKA